MKRLLLAFVAVLVVSVICSCMTTGTSRPERFSLNRTQQTQASIGTIAGTVNYGAGFYLPSTSDILDVAMLKTDGTTGLVTEVSHMRYRNFQRFPVQFSVRYDMDDVSESDLCSLMLTLTIDGSVKAQGITQLIMQDGKFRDASVTLLSI